MKEQITLNTKLSWEEFRKFNFYILYKRPTGIFLLIIGTMMWGVVLYYLFGNKEIVDEFPFFQLFFALFVTVILPLVTYFNSRRNFNANGRINEKISYVFDGKWIEIKGQSFESKLTWEKIYKVVETKSWFLIYTTKIIANIIPKKEMSDEEIQKMRGIIKSIPKLKNKLRKD